ncbi:effector-associated constant component EACC1 [Streptomyces lushanensis]|uniref:effector-associated constant component EACC1 n=1 Tax=Streptomyces lushanensis TaxID=1434255 RepID=UPI000834A878|nr:hypothetical protein [Streptomyces lushanensis]
MSDRSSELEVRVVADGHPEGGEEDLRSLLRWVDADESLRHEVRGRLIGSAALPRGSMGTGLDVLQLLIGSALSGGALAVSVLQWRDSRRRRPGLVLRRGSIEVEIPAEYMGTDVEERVIALLGQEPGGSADDEQAS